MQIKMVSKGILGLSATGFTCVICEGFAASAKQLMCAYMDVLV